ncbi:hypothetical protein EDC14_1006166 [Hydrogenispora ethanolica]|jgi:hypothetical protein|uniref:Uncharacterized protein n=1 Tax=Hydrogenispora ethanolica TaxID=1082276 RepID=A0A4R1S049_HYDET|nr:hypothetical protein EDC14_1006166 [Hydrogenispora ethanolica]
MLLAPDDELAVFNDFFLCYHFRNTYETIFFDDQ